MEATFSTVDYVILVLMLAMSLFIGLYYAVFKKQNSAKEYLHGGKSMNYFAVALSIISSILSGVTLISAPTETYYFGISYTLNAGAAILQCVVSYLWVTPVFFKLQLTSIYEYLELRFNSKVKVFSSVLYAVQMFLYLPLVIYAPGLAVAQMTNINVHFITPVICAVCILYTVFGGIKAVIWTDALQFFVMIGAMIVVAIMGVIAVGGLGKVFEVAYNTNRLHFDFDIDPTKRDTFWAVGIGCYAHLLGLYVFSQGNIQKYLAVRTYNEVKKTHIVSMIGLVTLLMLCLFCGLVILAMYVHCDPFTAKYISKPDQLVPYYVMDMARSVPGLSGLFVAGVISAGLSTLSASMNSLAATMYNDFIKATLPNKIVKKYEPLLLKLLVAAIGIICTALIFIVEHLGNILPLVISFSGITVGPMAGLFVVGMLIPKVNSKGALWGSVSSLLIMGWIIMSAQWYKSNGMIKIPTLPVYADQCEANTTYSSMQPPLSVASDVPVIYRITHYYYPVIGILITVLVSVVVSCFTKREKEVDDDFISPLVHYFRKKRNMKYSSVEQALNIVTDNSGSDAKSTESEINGEYKRPV